MVTFAEMTLTQRIDALCAAVRGHTEAGYVFSPYHGYDFTVVDGMLMRVVLNVPSVQIAPVKTLLTMSDMELYNTVMSVVGTL